MTELKPGLELGARFALIRRLGRGGNAEVWLADDRERGGPVALKLFQPAEPDPGLAARLAVEVARLRSLPPAHVVRVYGAGEAGGVTWLAMEHCPGGDLGQFRGRSFESWGKAVDDVAAALAAAHEAGVVHRDLKCSNVLLDGEGRARLADFGSAALAGSRAPASYSPYNASPQQLRGEPAAPADDLYALGALLYELIAGHPPYYPEITRDRVLHEPVPPLVPRGQVPLGIRELALQLLAKSPQQRPASAEAVRSRLAGMAGEGHEVAPLVHALPVQDAIRARGRRLLPWTVGGALVALAVALVWLPRQFQPEMAGMERNLRTEAESVAREREAEQAARQSTDEARTAAERARTAFDAALGALDERAAAHWATKEFAAARDAGVAAMQRYAVGSYLDAGKAWEAATAELAALEQKRPALLKDALQRGQQALAAGQPAAAREAFELALALEPGQAQAHAGIERAGKLDRALAQVELASAQERTGRLTDAEQGYRQALALDPAVPGASAGIARIAERRSGDAYAASMSQGLADVAAGRTAAARDAFRQALALRPGSAEARDALAALDQGQRTSAIALLESRARLAEADERWDDAIAAWREAAGIESTFASAREGIARATPRAELQRRVDALIREPERLWDPAGRAEARNVLATAAGTGNPRQRLAASTRQLQALAGAAQTPVKLRLESDGVTSVTIYRVGQYGSFARRDVELLPGRYTVVGTRNGFRDVRREIVLPPGTPVAAVTVRCEEPI